MLNVFLAMGTQNNFGTRKNSAHVSFLGAICIEGEERTNQSYNIIR